MLIRSRVAKALFAVVVLISIFYTLLMLRYQSIQPSDLTYSLLGKQWELDSAIIHKTLTVFGPDDRLSLDHADSIWSITGAIYGHNNLRSFLSIDAIQIRDDSAHFSANAPIGYLFHPTRADRRNPHYFVNEPFAMVYDIQCSNTKLTYPEFYHIIEKAFILHSLTIVVQTNHGSITAHLRGYKTMNSGDLVRAFPVPKQVF